MSVINMDALKALQEMAQHEVDETNSRNKDRDDQYPVVYTGENGKLTVRLLYNQKFEGIQRKIFRHDGGKSKVACLQVYGEECPVCSAIKEVESAKGKEIGVYRKYGAKQRGICYAQIIDHDDVYFKDPKDPKKRDVVLMMYPKTVYDQINKIIIDSGAHLERLVSENEGIPVVIERINKKGGFPDYTAQPFAYGAVKSFEDDSEKTGNQKFDEMIESLPNLGENFTPKLPNDEVRKANKALAEVIIQEFLSGNIVNPQTQSAPQENEAAPASKPQTNVMSADLNTSAAPAKKTMEKPECYGNHKDHDKKCLICPVECDCYSESN